MADALRDDGLLWLEEPVWPPEDCDGLARVAPARHSDCRRRECGRAVRLPVA